jgi:8-oxo-dGTP diphosphatase
MGHQSWSTPGGYLEFGEELAACAGREAEEEVGYQGGEFSFLALTNDIFETRHFVTVWMIGEADAGWKPGTSDEVVETAWFLPGHLPEPLFPPFRNLVMGISEPPAAFAQRLGG